jgi:hypothetical protein
MSKKQPSRRKSRWQRAKPWATLAAYGVVGGLAWQGAVTVRDKVNNFLSPDQPSITTDIPPPIASGTKTSIKSDAGTYEFSMAGKNKLAVKLSLIDIKYGEMNEAIDASNIICVKTDKTNKTDYQVIVDFRKPETIRFMQNGETKSIPVKQLKIPCGNSTNAKKVETLLVAIQRYGEVMVPAKKPKIDYKVIATLEGGQKLKAYIPNNNGKVIGKSGVTVATGVDLGQHRKSAMMKWDIPKSLRNKILPYAGKKKNEALEYLREHPLEITKEEATALDRVLHSNILADLVSWYDRDTKGSRFGELPEEAQTVLFSATYNMGYVPKAAPRFWGKMIEQDWEGASKLLQAWPTSSKGLKNRREREGEYLEAAITTPQAGTATL